jgi:hypothetical protein
MAEEKKAEKQDAGTSLDKAADRLRESARWMIVAFGGVATVIFAGLTVSDLGSVKPDTPDYRFALALLGTGLAIAGVAYALSVAIRLAGASTTTFYDLTRPANRWERSLKAARAEIAHDPSLARWDGETSTFVAVYNQAYENYIKEAAAYAGDSNLKPDPSELNKAESHLEILDDIAERVLSTTSFLRLQQSFGHARKLIAGSMVAAALGALAFGWATSSVPKDDFQVATRPTAAVLRPDEAVVKEINRQIGGCPQVAVSDAVAVLILDRNEDDATLDVVTVPDPPCRIAIGKVPAKQVTDK